MVTKIFVCPCCKSSGSWRQLDIYENGRDFYCWHCSNFFADPEAIWVDENGTAVN